MADLHEPCSPRKISLTPPSPPCFEKWKCGVGENRTDGRTFVINQLFPSPPSRGMADDSWTAV